MPIGQNAKKAQESEPQPRKERELGLGHAATIQRAVMLAYRNAARSSVVNAVRQIRYHLASFASIL